jgi:hypothetical protein
MVVDLAVEDSPHRAVLVAHRLMAALDVDDAQPPSPERDAAGIDVESIVIGPAVGHARGHAPRSVATRVGGGSTDPAHGRSAHLV